MTTRFISCNTLARVRHIYEAKHISADEAEALRLGVFQLSTFGEVSNLKFMVSADFSSFVRDKSA